MLILMGLTLSAQPGGSNFRTRYEAGTKGGSWGIEQYSDKILRISFRPGGAWTDQLYSDAVVAKPKPFELRRYQHATAKDLELGNWQLLQDSALDQLLIHHDALEDTVRLNFFARSSAAGFQIGLAPNEQIYGGGERAVALNRRGYRFPLYNSPWYGYSEGAESLNFSVPFFLSSRGYALFFDNPSKGFVDIGQSQRSVFEAAFTGGELNVYVIIGDDMDQQLRAFTFLTGRQPLPPRWALGNLVSRFGYTSQQEVLSTVKKMQSAKFPMDAIILDLFWFGDSIKGTLGNLDWVNHSKWPNPKGMIDSLRAQNIKTVLVTEPFVLQGTRNYTAATPSLATDAGGKPYTLTDLYFGKGGLIDLFRKDAQNWFWSKYDAQIKLGVAGWWGDLGEPEKHPSDLYHNLRDQGIGKPVQADLVHNLYGYTWSKMLAVKYRQFYPQQRTFFLNRAGFAGSARFSSFPWTGDVSRSWSGLRAQLPILQGMSVSGMPYIHADAGGFAGGDKDPELYLRWLQFAAFTPIFRPHGTNVGAVDPAAVSIPSEPVFWPEDVQNLARKVVQLRYDLLPYNYTLAYEQTQFGKPLMRPMNFYNYSDSNLNKATDQYMWGDNLLIAPVLYKGATTRRLYLPRGNWYNFFTNQPKRGGQWIEDQVYPDKIPVYVKAGAFIPTRPGLKNTEEYKTRVLVVKHYISASGQYILYDDDGVDPNAYERDNYERIIFQSQEVENGHNIIVQSDDRRYKGGIKKRIIVIDVYGLMQRPVSVKIGGLIVPYQNKYEERPDFKGTLSYWDPMSEVLRVAFEYTGNQQSIQVIY